MLRRFPSVESMRLKTRPAAAAHAWSEFAAMLSARAAGQWG